MEPFVGTVGGWWWLAELITLANQGRSSLAEALGYMNLLATLHALGVISVCAFVVWWAVLGGSAWGREKGKRIIPGPRGYPIRQPMMETGSFEHRRLAELGITQKATSLMAFNPVDLALERVDAQKIHHLCAAGLRRVSAVINEFINKLLAVISWMISFTFESVWAAISNMSTITRDPKAWSMLTRYTSEFEFGAATFLRFFRGVDDLCRLVGLLCILPGIAANETMLVPSYLPASPDRWSSYTIVIVTFAVASFLLMAVLGCLKFLRQKKIKEEERDLSLYHMSGNNNTINFQNFCCV